MTSWYLKVDSSPAGAILVGDRVQVGYTVLEAQ